MSVNLLVQDTKLHLRRGSRLEVEDGRVDEEERLDFLDDGVEVRLTGLGE